MHNVGLIGAGRIGNVHAASIAANEKATLVAVADAYAPAAEKLAAAHSARVATVEEIMDDESIDMIMICSVTDTHAEYIERGARAGKAIFCEKPIHLQYERVKEVLSVVEETGAKLMVGFNRRFDPNFRALKKRMEEGAIGDVELVTIASRDPAPPPVEYAKGSGGLFRDMTIHDFDMARWLLDEEPVEVFASASALVTPEIGEFGDVDTAVVTLTCKSGKIAVITNSRRATYGYDQRIEVHGSKGMLSAGNVNENTVAEHSAAGVVSAKPLHFFLERYMPAFQAELTAFIEALDSGAEISPGGTAGIRSLMLADAAFTSLEQGRKVRLE